MSSDGTVVHTVHKPLQFLQSFGLKNQHLSRWSLYLQKFNLSVKHVKGMLNVLADYLRRPDTS